MKTGKILIGALAGALCTGAAHASTAGVADSGWTRTEVGTSQVLASGTPGESGLVFACTSDGKLSALINIDGGDAVTKMSDGLTRVRSKSGKLDIDGRDGLRTGWHYYPAARMVGPKKPSVSRMIYNAAVTGATVSTDISQVGPVSITPPAINDAFKTFASTCNATNGK